MNFWSRLRETLLPFSEIAKELRSLRELYEESLAQRVVNPKAVPAPIFRLTEKPKPGDTEVFMSDDKPKSDFQRKAEEWMAEPDEIQP